MASLWSGPAEPWAATWARYDDVLRAVPTSDLAALDAWYLRALPPLVRAREPAPFVSKAELRRLMEWKLKKGKWRPQLIKFVTQLDEDDVERASRDALETLKGGDLRAATEALCTLKGVGPATASAVLAAYDASVPFMADEALEAVAGIIGPRKYTLPHFLSFAEQLRAKAEWLNEQRAANDDEKAGDAEPWTAQRVQLCLYAEAHDSAAASVDKKKKKKKVVSPAAKRAREKAETPPSAKKKQEKKQSKKQEETAEDQDQPLRRSQRKRQRPTV